MFEPTRFGGDPCGRRLCPSRAVALRCGPPPGGPTTGGGEGSCVVRRREVAHDRTRSWLYMPGFRRSSRRRPDDRQPSLAAAPRAHRERRRVAEPEHEFVDAGYSGSTADPPGRWSGCGIGRRGRRRAGVWVPADRLARKVRLSGRELSVIRTERSAALHRTGEFPDGGDGRRAREYGTTKVAAKR